MAVLAILREPKTVVVPMGRSGMADLGRTIRAIAPQSFPEIDKGNFVAQYWVGDAEGNPVPSAGTVVGGDATLRTDLANDAAGFSLIKYKSSQSSTFGRTAAQLMRVGGGDDTNIFHHIDPDYDEAILDGSVTDDLKSYIQNAVNQGGLKRAPSGLYTLGSSLTPINGTTLEGFGSKTILKALNASGTQPWVVDVASVSRFTLQNMKMIPASVGSTSRSAIRLATCTDAKVENVIIEGQTDSTGIYLFDCDRCIVDNLYFDGGSSGKHGTGVYNSGGRDCKVVNSHAVNCFAGFTISSAQTDFDLTPVASPRDVAAVYGNTIANCTVVNCTTQAFTITGATGNTIANSHAHDYAGAGVHKAFQVKDTAADPTRGNAIIGCTSNNYPAGFGGQQGSHAKFVACIARNCSTNAFELNSCTAFSIYACSAYEFAAAGIWTSSGTIRCHIDGLQLETSTTTAIGISIGSAGGADANNNFDNVTTQSTLAKFINIASGCNNNRFGRGCRSNGMPIVDASATSEWPVISTSQVVALTATSKNYLAPYCPRGMYLAAARLIITTTIAGTTSPQVAIGRDGASTLLAAAQTVTGAAPSAATLTLASTSGVLAPGQIPTWNVTTAASGGTPAGAGYVQIEGLLAS